MSLSRNQLTKWMNSINISDKTVLDIGAGPKEKWALNKVKGKPKLYSTADADSTFDCDHIIDLNESLSIVPTFDVVFCIECLEHTWNPIKAIENLSLMTKETLYLSTPFINPHHDKWDYFRFTGEWYEKILPMYGFKKVKITERIATDGLKYLKDFYQVEGLRISKIRPEYGKYTYPIGYCVEASK